MSFMKLIGKGKAKDIYRADNGDVIFEFTDRVTAFDGAKKAEFPHKRLLVNTYIFIMMEIDELTKWVLSVDRKVIVMKELNRNELIKASDI